MSFSLWVEVDHEDGYTSTFDIVEGQTYNLTPMWKAAGLVDQSGTRDLAGRTCEEMQPAAMDALIDFVSNPEKYRTLEPVNGWGDAEGFFEHGLIPFFRAVHRHPRGVIRWSG